MLIVFGLKYLVMLNNGLSRDSVSVICNGFHTFLDAYTDEISARDRLCTVFGIILKMFICCSCTYILYLVFGNDQIESPHDT